MDEKTKSKGGQNEAKNNTNHINVDALILVSLVVVLGVLLSVYFLGKKTPSSKPNPLIIKDTPLASSNQIKPTLTLAPTATPTPSPKPIPHGTTDFFVSVGKEVKGPRMGKGTIDPYDPEAGDKQRLTIAVSDTVPVTKVVATLKTDKKTSKPYELLPGSGTSMNSNWTGEWTIDDTYLYTYVLSIQATSSSGTSTVDVTLR